MRGERRWVAQGLTHPTKAGCTPAQRRNWRFIGQRQGMHWPELDEDLSIEGFYTYNKDEIEKEQNEVSRVFHQFPAINITRFAEQVKINRSLLASYVCNEKKPGIKNKKQIEAALHQLGKDLLAVKL